MNQLDQLNFANLTEKEVEALKNYEKDINNQHNKEEIYLLALKK